MPAQVVIGNNHVTKTQEPSRARLESEATQAAGHLAQRTGLFRVPRVLSQDIAAGELVFERINNARPLRSVVLEQSLRTVVAERMGLALGAIHASLRLPDHAVQRDPVFSAPGCGDEVFLHGDYSLENMMWQDDIGMLWIIDWSSAGWLGSPITVGPPGIDLVILTTSAFVQRAFNARRTPRPGELMQDVFTAYGRDRTTLEPARIAALSRIMLPLYSRRVRDQMGFAKALARLPGRIAARHYLRAWASAATR